MMPSIFGENLFDEFFDDDFPMIPMRSIRNPLLNHTCIVKPPLSPDI